MNASRPRALIVADSPVVHGWLAQVAGDVLELIVLEPLPAASLPERVRAALPAALLFCEFSAESLTGRGALVEQLSELLPSLPVVGVGVDDNAQQILAAMRAGARDYLLVGRDSGVSAQLARLLRRGVSPATANPPTRLAKLFTVLSGRPYDGTAFLAEHLALELQQHFSVTGERVLLMDLTTPPGAAAIFLNLNQSYSVLDALNDAPRCDQALVDSAFAKHAGGLHLLSLPEDMLGRPDLHSESLERLLQALRGLFAVIVVAADGNLPITVLARLVDSSERALLLTDQSILKSRYTKHVLRALRLEDCRLDRVGLVVDNYRRRLGLEPGNLAELFDLPLVATLRSDGPHRILSMNSGEPLFTLARKDPYCQAVRALAGLLHSGRIAEPPPRSLLQRWFGI